MGEYLRPDGLSEALAALRRPHTVLAGGTDFYPARVGWAIDEDVLDITAIASLRGISARVGGGSRTARAAGGWRPPLAPPPAGAGGAPRSRRARLAAAGGAGARPRRPPPLSLPPRPRPPPPAAGEPIGGTNVRRVDSS